MKKVFIKYYVLSLLGVLLASAYPIYMGILVISKMLSRGFVLEGEYPKYIIPYTPISIAIIFGILIMPVVIKCFKKCGTIIWSTLSLIVFFIVEYFMETKILVQAEVEVELEIWQMMLCYVPPAEYETRTWQAVDILLGGYSPAFKLHFYLISVVLILSILGCFYGFARMIVSGDKSKKKILIIQAISSALFMAMCIWACFTSFYRTGELQVPIISAVLMIAFFILLGVTMGIFVGNLVGREGNLFTVVLPSFVASLTTTIMYIGEMILLDGHLYRFGEGWFFEDIFDMALAPIDILTIICAGVLCGIINKISRR